MVVMAFNEFPKIWLYNIFILLLLILTSFGCNEMETDLVWLNNLPSAMAQARQQDKPIFMFFSATWCGNCRRLEKAALRDDETVTMLSQFVLLKLDLDESPLTAEQYGVQTVPMLLILGSDGTPYNAIFGVLSPASIRSFLVRGQLAYDEAMKQEESDE